MLRTLLRWFGLEQEAPQPPEPRPRPPKWPPTPPAPEHLQGMLEHPLPEPMEAMVRFLLGDQEGYEDLDFEGGKLLRQAYRDAPLHIRRMALARLRQGGRPDLLRAVEDSQSETLCADLGLEEVSTQLELLDSQAAFELLKKATPAAAALVVKQLKEESFVPTLPEDRQIFAQLLETCPIGSGRYLPYPEPRNRLCYAHGVEGIRFNFAGSVMAVRLADGAVRVHHLEQKQALRSPGLARSNAHFTFAETDTLAVVDGLSVLLQKPWRQDKVTFDRPVKSIHGGKGSLGAIAIVTEAEVWLKSSNAAPARSLGCTGRRVRFEKGYLLVDDRVFDARNGRPVPADTVKPNPEKALFLSDIATRATEKKKAHCAQLSPDGQLLALARGKEVTLHAVRDLGKPFPMGVYDLLAEWLADGLCDRGWTRCWQFVAHLLRFQARFQVELVLVQAPGESNQGAAGGADIAIEDFEVLA